MTTSDLTNTTLGPKAKNLAGRTFADLRVVAFHSRKNHQIVWSCICVCGGDRNVPSSWLLRGQAKHCGCKTHKAASVIEGQIFGRLVVLCKSKRGCYWEVKCSCGKQFSAYQSNLLGGSTTSCRACGHYRLPLGASAFNRLLRTYRSQATKRGLEFSLTVPEFTSIISKDCYYCGLYPAQEVCAVGSNGSLVYNGIDRLDNDIGYVSCNCVPCCKVCNHMKCEMSHDAFLAWIRTIANKHTPAVGERVVVEVHDGLTSPINLTVA